MAWELMYRGRACFPETIDIEDMHDACAMIEKRAAKFLKSPVRCEGMTDQIDVFVKGRRVATYMAM